MAEHEVIITIFKVLTVITSIMVRFSPTPDFRRIVQNKRTGEVVILPVVMLFTNCYVLVWYGYGIGDIFPLFCTGLLGLVTCLGFIGVYYHYADNRPELHKIFAVSALVMALVTLYGVLGVTGVTQQSLESVGQTMGAISIATAIAMFASPLATIRRVVRTKSSTSMPFTFVWVNVLNALVWIVYSSIHFEVFVLIPNVVGGFLSAVQMVLFMVYPSKVTETEVPSVMIDHSDSMSRYAREASLSIVITTPMQEGGKDGKTLDRKDSLNFVALRSPLTQLPASVSRID